MTLQRSRMLKIKWAEFQPPGRKERQDYLD